MSHTNITVVIVASVLLFPLSAADRDVSSILMLDCGSGQSLELVSIKPGTFAMGSPDGEEGKLNNEVLHTVTITKAFYMGKYAVTQEQYSAVIGKNPSYFKGSKDPVDEVSWNDAVDFCEKLSEKNKGKLPVGMKLQLPTEAQWEYACRAGTRTRFYSGDRDEDLGDVAWYAANSDTKTHPVGLKKPNAFGLYDMHGNVWQWCLDAYIPNYEKLPNEDPFNDQSTPALKNARVLRGGSYLIAFPRGCRAAIRYGYTPADCGNVIGFRIAVAVEPRKTDPAKAK